MANCFPPVPTAPLAPNDLPPRLTALGWRPAVYLRGAAPAAGPAVAIVGARAATGEAMGRAHALARHLTGRGVHVVSGGALGVDGAAHRGALAGGGATTVVVGTGVDLAYPARHASLFCEVLARGGGLIGLSPDGTEPRRPAFVQRNRLIAALVDVVIVVEAALRSGSLSTAAAGRSLGRVVAAWPGSPGCDQLIADGAAIVETDDDAARLWTGEPRVAANQLPEVLRAALTAGARTIEDIVAHTGWTPRAVLRAFPMLDQERTPQ